MFLPKTILLISLPCWLIAVAEAETMLKGAGGGRTKTVSLRRRNLKKDYGKSSKGEEKYDSKSYSKLTRGGGGGEPTPTQKKGAKSSKEGTNRGFDGSKSTAGGATDGTLYRADLGEYGDFYLHIPDDGTMSWKADLTGIDTLPNINTDDISDITYHLHNMWHQNDGKIFSDQKEECGGFQTGGHYDPYFACGRASANTDDVCIALGRRKDEPGRYKCSYAENHYDSCEVGDLSGKYGKLEVEEYGKAYVAVQNDPLPAVNYHYDPGHENDAGKFASVVFHGKGGKRILCGKLDPVL